MNLPMKNRKEEDVHEDGILPQRNALPEPLPEPEAEAHIKEDIQAQAFWRRYSIGMVVVAGLVYTFVVGYWRQRSLSIHAQLMQSSLGHVMQTTEWPRAESEPTSARDSNVELEVGGELGGKTFTMPLTRQMVPMQTVGDRLQYKSAYWGTLSVGHPAIPFKVVFDTGSGHLILPSTYCHSATCRQHRRYRRSASTSGVDIDCDGSEVKSGEARDQITVSFGTGEVSGVFLSETVCLGEEVAQKDAAAAAKDGRPTPGAAVSKSVKLPAPPATLGAECMRLRMIIATDMSEDPFRTFHFDGVLGLGLTSLSQTPEFNFVDGVARSILDGVHIFAIYLSATEAEKSEITFGGWKPSRLSGPLHWNKVLHPEHGHWLIEVKSVRIGNFTLPYCHEGCKAVVDTGTSLLAVPPTVFPEMFELMKHQTDMSHCLGDGPLLHIDLENTTITLGPRDYARLEQNQAPMSRPHTKVKSRRQPAAEDKAPVGNICKPMMISMELPEPLGPKLFVFGEPIQRKYYTVYDAGKKRVGFGLSSSPADQMPLGAADHGKLPAGDHR